MGTLPQGGWVERVIGETRVPIKVWAKDLEPEAEQQVRNLSQLPFIHRHIAVMADAHAGKGSTVGTVIATNGAIIPAAVGVDIGCGMCAVRLPFKIDRLGDLKKLRHSIERDVPVGFEQHNDPTERQQQAFKELGEIQLDHPAPGRLEKALKQLGTLGGGNHFMSHINWKDSRASLQEAIGDVPHQDYNNRDPNDLFSKQLTSKEAADQ